MVQFLEYVFCFFVAVMLIGWLVYRFGLRDWLRVRRENREHREQIERDKRKLELLEKLVQDDDVDKQN